jgi:glycosyltransferase involved in cell wall biosynthesis
MIDVLETPLVSVCCITYNHEKYIRDCITGFLNQKTSFQVEFLIHDDASTDNTQRIIRDLVGSDDRFKLILRTENIKSTGAMIFPILVDMAKGKYLAYCEGDDYWSDPHKLEKQVGLLEKNEGKYLICAHKINELNEFNGQERIFPIVEELSEYDVKDFIKENVVGTSSLVFRREMGFPLYPAWSKGLVFGDWLLLLNILVNGKRPVVVIPEVMSTYRINSTGIHGSARSSNDKLYRAYRLHLSFIKTIQNYLLNDKRYVLPILKKQIDTYKKLVSLGSAMPLKNRLKDFLTLKGLQLKEIWYS